TLRAVVGSPSAKPLDTSLDAVGSTPKASLTSSPNRPAMRYCKREAAFRRLTSVLPSRLASTRLSSSAIFSNSASRSCCLATASSLFWLAGHESSPFFTPPASIVTGSVRRGEPLLSFGGGCLSLGLGG